MAGIVGRLFHEFAVTIGAAVLFSGFVSLTLTPMVSSRVLRPLRRDVRHNRLYVAVDNLIQGSLNGYKRGLRWSLDHRLPLLIFSFITLVLTVVLFVRIPKGFLPSEDTGQFLAVTEAIQGVSFDAMSEHQLAVAADGHQGPERRDAHHLHRRRLAPEPGPAFRPDPAPLQAEAPRRRDHQRAAAEARPDSRGSSPTSRTPRRSRSAAASPRASTSSPSRAPTRSSSTTTRRPSSPRYGTCRDSSTSRATWSFAIRRSPFRWTATRR